MIITEADVVDTITVREEVVDIVLKNADTICAGLLKPDLNNDEDYWADTDFAEEYEYSSEYPPYAFQWTCCEGDASADACQSSYHVESSESKKARDLPVNHDAAVRIERLPGPTMDEELQKVDEKPQEEKIPGPTTSETSRLKRKEYTLNPVCSHCERQFDQDDNPSGCCRYHSGEDPRPELLISLMCCSFYS